MLGQEQAAILREVARAMSKKISYSRVEVVRELSYVAAGVIRGVLRRHYSWYVPKNGIIEDFVQDSFESFFATISRIDTKKNVYDPSYLSAINALNDDFLSLKDFDALRYIFVRIASRQCHRQMETVRCNGLIYSYDDEFRGWEPSDNGENDPARTVENGEHLKMVMDAINEMPPARRETGLLLANEFTQVEIADILGLQKGSVRNMKFQIGTDLEKRGLKKIHY